MKNLGVIDRKDFLKLMGSRLEDNGWSIYGMFTEPRPNTDFGSRELSSCFSIEAINQMK